MPDKKQRRAVHSLTLATRGFSFWPCLFCPAFRVRELANWFVNWFGELAVRSVSEFALDGIPLVRCIGSVVRPWEPEPSN